MILSAALALTLLFSTLAFASTEQWALSISQVAIFALGGGCTAVLAAIDGKASLTAVFARAGVPFGEGMTYVATLEELGLIALV